MNDIRRFIATINVIFDDRKKINVFLPKVGFLFLLEKFFIEFRCSN